MCSVVHRLKSKPWVPECQCGWGVPQRGDCVWVKLWGLIPEGQEGILAWAAPVGSRKQVLSACPQTVAAGRTTLCPCAGKSGLGAKRISRSVIRGHQPCLALLPASGFFTSQPQCWLVGKGYVLGQHRPRQMAQDYCLLHGLALLPAASSCAASGRSSIRLLFSHGPRHWWLWVQQLPEWWVLEAQRQCLVSLEDGLSQGIRKTHTAARASSLPPMAAGIHFIFSMMCTGIPSSPISPP